MTKDFEFDEEAAYLPDRRKELKFEKKLARQKDRSKYKKTDLDKQAPSKIISKEGLLLGRVLAITPQEIMVECENKLYACSLKGSLKQEKNKIKNLVTVGDNVYFEPINIKDGVISIIQERKSILSRQDHLLRRKEQLIAANIDLVLITISVVTPALKPALIDRYIIAAQKGNMQPILVINKIDLLKDHPEEQATFDEIVRAYRNLNIPVIPVSTITHEGLDVLREAMKDKLSVFSGQSGTGKSSLITEMTNIEIATQGIIKKTNKGMHTTTTTRLLPLPFGGFCIDTPGIRSFGVWALHKEEVEGYFEEILESGHNCKYPSCTHTQEPGCAVRKAVEEGIISYLRYESYLKLISQENWELF